MSNIPLDIQRRCEQRWAARFARRVPRSAPHVHRPEKADQRLAESGKAKMQTRRTEAAGLMSVAAACERGDVA
jgi:hypothetical protein